MEIQYLNKVDSTHTYLKKIIKQNGYIKPISVATQHQTSGIGSRDNSWEGKDKNLFFSFVLDKILLPLDLPIQSYSIYFSYILKDMLKQQDSKVWLKWPNDFYINDKKIGGTITNISGDLVYCGIGLNLNFISDEYGYL
ncbi:MAG: biotin--[acetyl-CoA-carboxylase] ligase, partial [Campylobacterota bacterium]|nr:biotin--[acetyl-CoA-carboxylase] ligase [Campylobacterota bacterium]